MNSARIEYKNKTFNFSAVQIAAMNNIIRKIIPVRMLISPEAIGLLFFSG